MAYNFIAERRDSYDLRMLLGMLLHSGVCEFFPIEVGDDVLILGMSIPSGVLDEPDFENKLQALLFMVLKHGFVMIDLFTGKPVQPSDVVHLVGQISGKS